MIALRPFFFLLGRASVFWLGAVGLFAVSLTVAGLAEADDALEMYLDAIFVAAFAFPGVAGWIAGGVIQELQHTTFASLLPGVRWRLASGFLVAGLGITGITVACIAQASASPQNLAVLFLVGLAAYCLGGILLDPLSSWITAMNVTLSLLIIVTSREIARIASDHPWLAAGVSLGVGIICVLRLFAHSTFRRKPFRATAPFPGRFSVEKNREFQRQRRIRAGAKGPEWRAGYLGSGLWRWMRAAVYEGNPDRGWKPVLAALGRAWGLGLLVVAYAWADKGEMSLGEALARSIYDALFRSPFEPQFGEKGGPFPLVLIVIALVGASTALFSPLALSDRFLHPLSRRQRAGVRFRCGLVQSGWLLFTLGPFLFALGHILGWLVGYELRLDFVPFFFRVLMLTLIWLPAAQWGGLRLEEAAREKEENTLVGVIFGMTGFVVLVAFWTLVLSGLSGFPLLELFLLAVALLISQGIYRQGLIGYYRSADLA